MSVSEYVIPLENLRMSDVPRVGGKNASLGEMIGNLSDLGVRVPGGFATSAEAYQDFIKQDGLGDRIHALLADLDVDNIQALTRVGAEIREMVETTPFSDAFRNAIATAYDAMGTSAVAVRSSATAEDLPTASFAGQQETFLNVEGIDAVLDCVKKVFASLFNDRAIAYRVHQGFSHELVSLSAGIQKMVRSDKASSGVMFTLDTESGFDDVVFITGAYGLGELVVQGVVNPDEFYLYKPNLREKKPAVLRRQLGAKQQRMIYDTSGDALVKTEDVGLDEQKLFCISDRELEDLGQQALLIEKHYQCPMDIEWAKDGIDQKIYIVQARPETVKSRDDGRVLERFHLASNHGNDTLCEGRSIGQKVGKGKAKIIRSIDQMDDVKPGEVLVTDMTDPDWEPVMKRAAAIVTNRGGRTCHAAIIARELGIPAVVGCGDATQSIKDGQKVTVSCAEGDIGFIYEGDVPFEVQKIHLDKMPDLPFKIMMNVGNPDRAFSFRQLPNHGVGLARLEFVISQMIGIHPRACLEVDSLEAETQRAVREKTAAYASPREYYVEKLKEGISTLGAAFAPKKVIIRLSDFKSNEYANLLGGQSFEPEEENPMIGFRGASRYTEPTFADSFAMECEAVKRARVEMGLENIEIMIPFVRTLGEAKAVMEVLKANGLERGKDGLRIIMMCELPTNALLAEEYLEYFDGFSIGSNDMTQLTLGLDRDSGIVAHHFDERDPAVKKMLSLAIQACRKQNRYIGICGQGPSDHPDLAAWLMEEGIESVSLNPDTVLSTWLYLAKENA